MVQRWSLTLACLAAGWALLPAGSARAATVTATDVRSPSGLITCWAVKYGKPGIECGAPYLPHTELDGFIALGPHGRASLGERGDYPGYGHRRRTLRYGDVWKRPGIRCTMRTTGLRCRNLDGHGFRLAKGAVRRFSAR